MVHDPQPAALRAFAGPQNAKWIWRCHIDSSHPDEQVGNFLRLFLEEHDAMVFTMPQFVLPDLRAKKVDFIAPAIDPLAIKNMELPLEICKRAMADSGIDPECPVLLQVSRFNPWKNPLKIPIFLYLRI